MPDAHFVPSPCPPHPPLADVVYSAMRKLAIIQQQEDAAAAAAAAAPTGDEGMADGEDGGDGAEAEGATGERVCAVAACMA